MHWTHPRHPTEIIIWTHKRHPIARPMRASYGDVFCWLFGNIYRILTATWIPANQETGYKIFVLVNYIPRIRRIGGCYGFTSKPPAARRPPPAARRPPPAARRPPPAARRPPPAARRPPPAARNGVNAITQKPRDGLFSNLVYTLVVIVSWPD